MAATGNEISDLKYCVEQMVACERQLWQAQQALAQACCKYEKLLYDLQQERSHE